ncbi:MAG: hypothetical protein HY047_01240 [Acidobacteria bacterium]|nr:hypothetical protein [Acidobacteriota bacterium]
MATEPAPLDRALSEAESVELRAKDHPRAILLYERALATAARDRRTPILHRLARTLRKAGRDEEALALYRKLAASSDRIGALPADLIAQYEICSLLAAQAAREPLASAAFDLSRELVGGRWVLEKARYLFYAATFVAEHKRHLATQDIGVVAAQMQRWLTTAKDRNPRGLLLAPYVRVEQATTLRERGIDSVDLVGNVRRGPDCGLGANLWGSGPAQAPSAVFPNARDHPARSVATAGARAHRPRHPLGAYRR